MWVAFTVGVVSIIVVALMAKTAVAQGFAVLVVPLFVLEVMLLAAIYLLWRALAGEDDPEGQHRPRASQPWGTPGEGHPGRPKVTRALHGRNPRSPIAASADWWFKRPRQPRSP